tara:strand:+ start:143 stop:337 length:195 start_codon:yes stop_codon:yes gene_type:complete
MNKELTELLINVQNKARTLEQELEKARSLLSFVKDTMKFDTPKYRETTSFKMLNEYFNELKTKK